VEHLLQVKNLHTSFFTHDGEVKAVKGLDFHIDEGETLGIVGESGSGKSVASLSILKLLPPSGAVVDGEILLRGRDLVHAKEKELRDVRGGMISMVFQDPMSSLNPLIPVGRQVEEMILTHRHRSRREIKRDVIDLFERVHIPDPGQRYRSYPHEFSGGMRQRVMIAIALACRPALLIADEPTTALDVTIQDQILTLLGSLQDEFRMSILFISHDLGVIAEICSRIMVMYGGMVMETARTEDIFARPSHPYTIGLLESIPSIVQDRKIPLQPIPGSPPDASNPPPGCPFHPRCRFARAICGMQTPPLIPVGDNHHSRCWLLDPGAPATDNPFGNRENRDA
jgi:oligopeptide transport system ATP-binding protein